MTYLLKHIDGIMSHIKGHTSQREDVTGRLLDAIVYITLLWGMIVDDKGQDPIVIREETRGEWISEPRRD